MPISLSMLFWAAVLAADAAALVLVVAAKLGLMWRGGQDYLVFLVFMASFISFMACILTMAFFIDDGKTIVDFIFVATLDAFSYAAAFIFWTALYHEYHGASEDSN